MSAPHVQRTTRICVKNVPPTFDETTLRRHLLESGPASLSSSNLAITDCRILKTKEGKSRKLAFVGFKTHDQALSAVEAFNGTYAKTSRLAVELAFLKKLSAEEAGHRPWSKHSKGSSRYEHMMKAHEGDGESAAKTKNARHHGGEKNDTEKVDEELMRKKEEFLRVMGATTPLSSGGKTKAWANDNVGALVKNYSGDIESDASESDYDDDDGSASDDSSVDSGGEGADALAGSRGAYTGAAVSDMDFLHAKTTEKAELSDEEEEEGKEKSNGAVEAKDGEESLSSTDSSSSAPSSSNSDEDSDSDNDEGVGDEANEKATESTSATGDGVGEGEEGEEGCARDRLFVRNLPFSATEEEVKELFDTFGQVVECHIPIDDSKKNKGYAFVRFGSSSDALAAREALDGSDFQGRLMHVLPARKGREEDSGDGGGGNGDYSGVAVGTTYKQKQELARQKGAENVAAGWSSSFVRGDAVIDNLSDRLGLAKGDILNVKERLSSGGAAVRLALGETQIIEENREYFEQHGIDMNILVSGTSVKGGKGDGAKRSKEQILVKNLPYDTTEEDLTNLFHSVGDAPARILLPPSRTVALVEYSHAVDARKAFRKLAYKRFKHVPLYLEWAPLAAKRKNDVSSMKTLEKGEHEKESNQASHGHVQPAVNNSGNVDDDEQEGGHGSPSYALYVKNLSFSTTEQQLLDAFKSAGHKARAVRIPTKLAPVKKHVVRSLPGAEPEMKKLSMGFGFVEFDSEKAACQALKKMRGTFLNGHAIEIKLSSTSSDGASGATSVGKGAAAPTSGGLKNKKLMIRNVPFQATKKEILQLFGVYGHLKKVRLPKKFDGSHRGFAFVEFLTSQEAQNAMTALSSTHLYGRHLVLEWADDKEDVDTLRDRAKRDAHNVGGVKATGMPKNKKIRFD